MVGGCVAWALLLGLYLALAGQASMDEAVAGAVAGLAAALLSVAVRRTAERRFSFRHVPWLHVLSGPAVSLAKDTVRVGIVLARAALYGAGAVHGAVVRQPFSREGQEGEAAARRALVTFGVSLPPNSYVLRIADERDEMRLHRLAEWTPSPDREWPL